MREFERRVVLSTMDRRWRDHLYEMEYLKEGIGLRAMAQRDPLVEYQREGYTIFQNMMGQIKEESLGLLYNLEVQVRPATPGHDARAPRGRRARRSTRAQDHPRSSATSAPGEDGRNRGPQRRGRCSSRNSEGRPAGHPGAGCVRARRGSHRRGAFSQQVAAPSTAPSSEKEVGPLTKPVPHPRIDGEHTSYDTGQPGETLQERAPSAQPASRRSRPVRRSARRKSATASSCRVASSSASSRSSRSSAS